MIDKKVTDKLAELVLQERENIQKAINKIDNEADTCKDDAAVRIASYIIDNFITTNENAIKVQNKTLADCIHNIEGKAQRQAKDNYAIIEERTVWKWVREFYGFSLETKVTAPAVTEKAEQSKPQETVNLLDFI